MTENTNQPTQHEWYFDNGDSGDSSVGMQPIPPMIYAEIPFPDGSTDTVTIAELVDPVYSLPYKDWTDEEKAHHQAGNDEWTADYPPGTRFAGNAQANGEWIVACAKFCAGLTKEQLEGLTRIGGAKSLLFAATPIKISDMVEATETITGEMINIEETGVVIKKGAQGQVVNIQDANELTKTLTHFVRWANDGSYWFVNPAWLRKLL